MPDVGKKAPAFTLPNQNEEKVALKDLTNKNVVLYFYPRDNTSGCTREAEAFRDRIKEIEKLDAVVVGVSPDTPKSHAKFVEKLDLPFALLSDVDRKVLEKYDALKEKTMYGKKRIGVQRSTYILGKDGKVKKAFPKVKVDGHADEVIAALKELS
jgi:thioredoxin-dependent peroxiredoxin